MIYNANPEDGFQIDARDTMYPSTLTVRKTDGEHGSAEGTVYGYVVGGKLEVKHKDTVCQLGEGGFFAVPGGVQWKFLGEDSHAQLVLIERFGYKCMPTFGTREKRGRLAYIDGCSDSILVHPARAGDSVLNHLHFPGGILQTQHTHPSIRLGIVADGKGHAWQQTLAFSHGWRKKLVKGGVFMLEESELHSFMTEKDHMDVIAYHPDSEDGATDDKHPMLSRTYIDHGGGRASSIRDIQEVLDKDHKEE